ncbi:hypothetical protein TNCV_2786631 [Trichonephila clavipes]|nr:hypothetical protein TNCV_2786631 [Trichonephila clavipes]
MTSSSHMFWHFQESVFNKIMLNHTQQRCHNVASSTLPPFHGLLDPQNCQKSNISGSFWTASWIAYEFERTRGSFIATVECVVSKHHT